MSNLTATTNTNFKETYFVHPSLTKIQGEPTYRTLSILYQEIKANAASVPSNLGGGAFGYLGLVLSKAQYALLSDVPFVRPVHPGALVIPPNSTGPQTATLQQTYDDNVKIHRECQAIDKVLLQLSIEAIESQYLQAIRNRQTGQYATTIRELIQYLFTTFGRITPTELDQHADKVKKMNYNLSMPIDSIFNDIEELSEYADAAETPYTQQQLIDLGYLIISKTNAFSQDIRAWLRRPRAEHTWQNFKEHFRTAYQELRTTQGTTTDDLGYANAIAEMVIDKLNIPSTEELEQQAAAAASQQQSNQELNDLLSQLLKALSKETVDLTPKQDSTNQNRRRQNQRRQTAKKPRKYCWTHGACAHSSTDCNTPAQGHKKEATFNQMMNGSTNGCFWLQNPNQQSWRGGQQM